MTFFPSKLNKRNGSRKSKNSKGRFQYKKTSLANIISSTEFKVKYTTTTQSEITSAGAIASINSIDQGDTKSDRSGRKIRITKVSCRIMVEFNPSSALTVPNQNLRFMLIVDRQARGSLFGLTAILNDGSISDSIVSPYNLDNSKRFHVYCDQVCNVSSAYPTRFINLTIMPNFDVIYTGTGGGVSDIITNLLGYLFVSDIAGGSNGPLVTATFTVRFADL